MRLLGVSSLSISTECRRSWTNVAWAHAIEERFAESFALCDRSSAWCSWSTICGVEALTRICFELLLWRCCIGGEGECIQQCGSGVTIYRLLWWTDDCLLRDLPLFQSSSPSCSCCRCSRRFVVLRAVFNLTCTCTGHLKQAPRKVLWVSYSA